MELQSNTTDLILKETQKNSRDNRVQGAAEEGGDKRKGTSAIRMRRLRHRRANGIVRCNNCGTYYQKDTSLRGIYCQSCLSDMCQYLKEYNKKEYLVKCVDDLVQGMNSNLITLGHKTLYVEHVLKKFATETTFDVLSIRAFLKQQLMYDCMVVDDENFNIDIAKLKKHNNSIKGSRFPSGYDFNKLRQKAFSCNTDSVVLIGMRSHPDDFVVIYPDGEFDSKDIIEMSREEMLKISSLELSGRSGAAGGCVKTDTNSHSLSKCTHGSDTRFIASGPGGVSMNVQYYNKLGDKKQINIYNDIFCSRYDKKQKQRMMMEPKNKALRAISIREMKTRLITLLICLDNNIVPSTVDKKTVLEKFCYFWKHDTCESRESVASFITLGHNFFESVLLSWACTSGEMRNHEALAAHVDGNKSHFLETLSLFPRIESNEQLESQKNIDSFMKNSCPGLLIFPLEGLILEYYCGRTVINCSLKHTIHLPDNSRNNRNWSRVYGP